jgi:hypothetical protein
MNVAVIRIRFAESQRGKRKRGVIESRVSGASRTGATVLSRFAFMQDLPFRSYGSGVIGQEFDSIVADDLSREPVHPTREARTHPNAPDSSSGLVYFLRALRPDSSAQPELTPEFELSDRSGAIQGSGFRFLCFRITVIKPVLAIIPRINLS